MMLLPAAMVWPANWCDERPAACVEQLPGFFAVRRDCGGLYVR
jgi:hypothetical protein